MLAYQQLNLKTILSELMIKQYYSIKNFYWSTWILNIKSMFSTLIIFFIIIWGINKHQHCKMFVGTIIEYIHGHFAAINVEIEKTNIYAPYY